MPHTHSLTANADTLDQKCDDLARQLADVQRQCSTLQRKNEKLLQERLQESADQRAAAAAAAAAVQRSNSLYDPDDVDGGVHNHSGPESIAYAFRSGSHSSFASSSLYGDDLASGGGGGSVANGSSGGGAANDSMADKEEYSHVVNELNATRRQFREEQQRVNDLEDQLTSLSEFGWT